jgi:hypothetical protein
MSVPAGEIVVETVLSPETAPADVRAALESELASNGKSWADVSFVGVGRCLPHLLSKKQSAQFPNEPDWIVALSGGSPVVGETLRSSGAWTSTTKGVAISQHGQRALFCVRLFEQIEILEAPEG